MNKETLLIELIGLAYLPVIWFCLIISVFGFNKFATRILNYCEGEDE